MRLRGSRHLFAAILASVALITACQPAAPSASAPAQSTGTAATSTTPKTLVLGVATQTTGCDGPAVLLIVITLSCPGVTQETLVNLDWHTNKATPGLAVSWTEQPDAITFKLRPNVKFQDGTPFNADAVVFNFRRAFDKTFAANQGLTVPYASFVPFKSVERIDDMTVKVNITPSPIAILTFSSPATYIQSPTAVQAKGKDYGFNPVGTGPYKIASLEDKARVEFVRNPDYWGEKPQPDRIVLIIKSDSASLANDILSGAIDALMDPPVNQLDQIQSAGLKVQFFPALIYNYYGLNVTKPPFDDVRVRQAANYAFDKEAVVKATKGGATALYSVCCEGGVGYNPDVAQYKYDPAKAKQLLDDAGWKLPSSGAIREKNGQQLAVTVLDRTGRTGVPAAEIPILISNLQDVGFKITSDTVDSAVITGAAGIGDPKRFNLLHGGQGNLFPDPQIQIERWTTSNLPGGGGGGLNAAWYSNPTYDQLVKQAGTELDVTKRATILMQVQKLLRDEAPIIWTSRQTMGMVWNPKKIDAIPLTPSSVVELYGVKLK